MKKEKNRVSKMGNYNLELQEQADKLGFSTTMEALDNGFKVENNTLVYDMKENLEQEFKEWELSKYTNQELVNELARRVNINH